MSGLLLVIDVGNTNTVFALHPIPRNGVRPGGARFLAEWRMVTDGRRTADEYFVWLHQLMANAGLERRDVSAIIIASVAPQTLFNLRRLAESYFSCTPMVLGEPGLDLGVPIRMDRPAEVGADRIVNAVAAYKTYGPDLIVIDFGTATTFDVVDHDGGYIGGVLAPGVNLSSEALFRATSKLPRIDIARPARVIGTDTVPAMQSGLFWGYVSLVEGVCARIAEERQRKMTVIATGGLSTLFAEGADVIDHIDPDLTMRGLVEIYSRNAEPEPSK